MLYALIDLQTLARVGDVGPLPATLRGLAAESVVDLSWAVGYDAGWAGRGFWPVVEIRPEPASWQRNAAEPTLAVDGDGRRVTATYALEPRPLATVKSERLAALSAHRWRIETGGITISGVQVRTDIESQGKITGAAALVKEVPDTVIDWKGASGWVQLDAETMTAIALAVGTHIQGCYSAEKAHAAAISACNTAEAAGTYDFTGGWPA